MSMLFPIHQNPRADINLSCVGKLKQSLRPSPHGSVVVVKTLSDGSGKAYNKPKIYLNSQANLKRGGREELKRDTLTKYGSSQIRKAGRIIRYMVDNEIDNARSSVMITLTYGKESPDHKTAKKHLNTFLTRVRKLGELKYYVWIAQEQTGKRALEAGKKSYRAEHGNAIHFHILTMTHKGKDMQVHNAQNKLRAIWKQIVNKWEVKSGFEAQNIGGVDFRCVHNASNYVARYLKNEQDTIIGNMWNMSASMREAIKEDTTEIEVSTKAWEYTASRFHHGRMKIRNQIEPKYSTRAYKLWNDTPVLVSNDMRALFREVYRNERNLAKLSRKQTKTSKKHIPNHEHIRSKTENTEAKGSYIQVFARRRTEVEKHRPKYENIQVEIY